jgi:type IX secretion system PorP/SprF family membrane protein
MRIYLITFVFFGLSLSLKAQQIPQNSQFALNPALLNPAVIGIEEGTEILVGGRWQMLGFGNEPRTAFGLYSKRLKTKEKELPNPALNIGREIPETEKKEKTKFSQAVGAQISLDKYGAFGAFAINGLYACHVQINRAFTFSGGAKLGLTNNSFDASRAIVSNILDPSQSYQGGDAEYDQFIAGRTNNSNMNLGVGIKIKYNDFFIAAAADQLTENSVEFGNSSANFETKKHFFVSTGYNINVSDVIKLKAIAQFKKMQPAPLSSELAVIAEFDENLFAGMVYRHNAAVALIGGFNINDKFRLGYSIDFTINKLNNASNGGHELTLKYRF